MPPLPVTRVMLYKHGVGYFERQGTVEGDASLTLTFKQSEVSDVLKSLTVLDLDGGHIAAVSYDSTKPIEQLLSEIALSLPDGDALQQLLPQLKGARVSVGSASGTAPQEGVILGIDVRESETPNGVQRQPMLSLLGDDGELFAFDLFRANMQLLDPGLRRDLDFYLRTMLSSKKKDARSFTLFAQGHGSRTVRLSYVLEAPVWKATYRILLNSDASEPRIQGWAVVDNMSDDDWENVQLSLIAGLPVSFIHDLYTPRYIQRPTIEVKETTGVLPPEMAMSFRVGDVDIDDEAAVIMGKPTRPTPSAAMERRKSAASSMPTQVRERQIGDLFEYEIEHPVTIRRNQSALVPIVLKPFQGRTVLLYQKHAHPGHPLRCVEFTNSTGLTLEGGPITVLEDGTYVGEAMLDTLKPNDKTLVPFAVELGVRITDSIDSHDEQESRLTIVNGVIDRIISFRQTTTYTIEHRGEREQTIFIDHPRQDSQWRLLAPASGFETSDQYWRFRFVIPPNSTTRWAIHSEKPIVRKTNLMTLDHATIALWIERKTIDEATVQRLREILHLNEQLAALEQQLVELQAEREQIHGEQKRIRENLQALSDQSGERELRDRFVRTLNTQEDRLERIVSTTTEVTRQRHDIRQSLSKAVQDLQFDRSLSAVQS